MPISFDDVNPHDHPSLEVILYKGVNFEQVGTEPPISNSLDKLSNEPGIIVYGCVYEKDKDHLTINPCKLPSRDTSRLQTFRIHRNSIYSIEIQTDKKFLLLQ